MFLTDAPPHLGKPVAPHAPAHGTLPCRQYGRARAVQYARFHSTADVRIENVQMRRQSGLPELSRAEALAPAGTTVATMSRPAAIVPATVLSADIPAAAPAEPAAAVVPPTLPDTARLAQPSPPVSPTALRRESADSGCNAPRPSPAKRPRHGIAGSHPAPPRKNESAAPALPSKQVCTEPVRF